MKIVSKIWIRSMFGALICGLFFPTAFAQPVAQWVAQFNGLGNSMDQAVALALDHEGNVLVTGRSWTGGTSNWSYATIKYDPIGSELWARYYDGPYYRGVDFPEALAVDAEGNAIVTGWSNGPGRSLDYATIKYDSDGNQLWVSRFNSGQWDYARAVAVDHIGNVIVTGDCGSDICTVKYDAIGNELWVKQFTEGRGTVAALAVDEYGNVVVTGEFDIPYVSDKRIVTIKYDADGSELWVQTYQPNDSDQYAESVAIDDEGNVIVTGWGYRYIPNTYIDMLTIKYDSDGNELWVRYYDGSMHHLDQAYDLALDGNGNIWVTGVSREGDDWYSSSNEITTIKYDPNGNELWVRHNNPGTDHRSYRGSYGLALAVNDDGYAAVTGKTYLGSSDIPKLITVKYDPNGNEQWSGRYASVRSEAQDIAIEPDGDVLVTGYAGFDSSSNYNYVTIKYLSTTVNVDEGSTATLTGSYRDPGIGSVTLSASEGNVVDNGDGSWDWSHLAINGPENRVVAITADYSDGSSEVYRFGLVIDNVAPTISTVDIPLDPIPVGASLEVSAGFSDPGIEDIHKVVWDWGDESSCDSVMHTACIIEETDGSGVAYGSHVYNHPGLYTITVSVTDNDGGFDSTIHEFVVVYDPEGGFVTGGGWIDSPAGAYTEDSSLIGKGKFGFVSKYKKGADVPTGETEFQFHAGNLYFESSSYQWLVISGARARFKGDGKINGTGNYGFMLTALDEKLTPSTDVDMFRIKIWDKTNDEIVYDNELGVPEDADPATAIEGGSIVVHKAKK